MSKCHSDPETGNLYPWALDEAEQIWNTYGAQALGFRTFTTGSRGQSRSRAAVRLSCILRENCVLLGGSRYSDLDCLFEEFLAQLQFSLLHIAQQGIDRINEQTSSELSARLGFWAYLRPDLRAMKTLSDERLGVTDQDNIQDLQRRKRKAEILREFAGEVKDFAKRAAYLSGSDQHSNQKLEQALAIARQALSQAEDDLRWSEG